MDSHRRLTEPEQQEAVQSLRAGLVLAGISLHQLSDHALALDAALTGTEVAAVIAGHRRCTAHEHDVLAQAINDHLVDRGSDHPVRYSNELSIGGGD